MPMSKTVAKDTFRLFKKKMKKDHILVITQNKKQILQLGGQACQDRMALPWMVSIMELLPEGLEELSIKKATFLKDLYMQLHMCSASVCAGELRVMIE